MKRLVVAIVLLTALNAVAAITLSVQLNDTYQTELETQLAAQNRDTCKKAYKKLVDAGGTPAWTPKGTCTQAQACAALGATGGAACNTNQAAKIGFYTVSQAGREEFAGTALRDALDLMKNRRSVQQDSEDMCDFFRDLTPTERATECARYKNSPANCNPFNCLGL